MVQGTLEVLLVGAKGLQNSDYLCNMDPYAILTYRSQEQRSSTASGKGSEPEWNETFVFTTSDKVSELTIKLMDSDIGSSDDFLGLARIPLDVVFVEGKVPVVAYNIVKDQEFLGEVKVALSFSFALEAADTEESYGGWKETY